MKIDNQFARDIMQTLLDDNRRLAEMLQASDASRQCAYDILEGREEVIYMMDDTLRGARAVIERAAQGKEIGESATLIIEKIDNALGTREDDEE